MELQNHTKIDSNIYLIRHSHSNEDVDCNLISF